MKDRQTLTAQAGGGGALPSDRAPTMMDVATAAGVSQTTVSLVLNNVAGARLSAPTRKKVQQVAKDMGYRLNQRGTHKAIEAESSIIGFITDEIATDPWCAIAMDGVREQAWQYGLTIRATVTRGDKEMEEAVHEQMTRRPLAGMIYATIQTRRIKPMPALYSVPTVLLNCYVQDHSLASVVPGELVGGYVATRQLIRAGHTRIAHMHGQPWMDASRDRLKGYRRALAEFNIPFDAELVEPGNWEPSAGYEKTNVLMDLSEPPTAIFCANDLMAMGCYDALRERGLRIPDDVAVVGYDDREIAQFMRPPLTTVLLPHYEMGVQAAEVLIDSQIQKEGRQPQIKVECPLVERDSV